jgi:hypothetical protein
MDRTVMVLKTQVGLPSTSYLDTRMGTFCFSSGMVPSWS